MKRLLALMLFLALFLACAVFPAFAAPDAESVVNQLLAETAAGQKDVWTRAILEAGAREVRIEDDVISFSLRGFDPGVKALGSFTKASDPDNWLESALNNLSSWNLRFSLPLNETGTVSKKTATAFLKDVKSAAGKAKSGMTSKDFTAALTRFFRVPPTDASKVGTADLLTATPAFAAFIEKHRDAFPCESAAEWAPLFYAQRNYSFTFSGGPHAITLKWDSCDPEVLLDRALDSAVLELASAPAASRMSAETLPALLRSSLASTAIDMFKQKLTSRQITFDIDVPASGSLPEEYSVAFSAYQPDTRLAILTRGYNALPEEAAEESPKSGTITQAKRGRNVTFIVPKTGRDTYIQLRNAETGVIVGDAFLTPGKNTRIKVPEGSYVVQYASGSSWYGLTGLFGPMGTYQKSEPFILGKKALKLYTGENGSGITLLPADLSDFDATEDKSVLIKGSLEPTTPVRDDYADNNPVIEGISSLTGLPLTGEKSYTPIAMTLDNAEEAYPHWGVSKADILFQVPNAGSGATKLMALFASEYPVQAGPVRSGRASMLPVATSFNAAIAYAGPPAGAFGNSVNLDTLFSRWHMTATHRVYNLLLGNGYSERRSFPGVVKSHTMSCHISMIHDNLLNKQVAFEERPFLFTDEPVTTGEPARIIRIVHRGEDPTAGSNSASRSDFKYDAATGQYTRTNSSGLYIDRDTGETVTFSNVIVLRTAFGWEDGYVFLKNQLAGSGVIEIFQDGLYTRGAWLRKDDTSRLILIDENGDELKLRPGKTFIIVTNDVTEVTISE